jgi:hypothetical protein
MALKDATKCTAKAKHSQQRCGNPAVTGYNVCRMHGAGGKSKPNLGAIRHGRYSRLKTEQLRSLIAEFENDPDPLNLMAELAAARALFQDFTDRYVESRDSLILWSQSRETAKPTQILDIGTAYKMVSEITRIVERIEKVRASNAISRPDLMRVLTEMSRVVSSLVDDSATLENVKDAWVRIQH